MSIDSHLVANRRATRFATRLAFMVAGFGIACWAPLIPFVKARLAVDDAVFGLLLLCLGAGSIASMLLTGYLSTAYGSRPIILAGGVGLSLTLPLLSIAASPVQLAIELALFGASLGSLDVAMNIHAIEVEHASVKPLMSGFHALFSLGGLLGSLLMTLLISTRLSHLASAAFSAMLMLVSTLAAWPLLLRQAVVSHTGVSARPHGIVLLLAALACISFLAEGAVLDWSALLITERGLVSVRHGGIGYALFATAMTVGRLGGDRLVARFGDRIVLFSSSLTAVGGFILVVASAVPATAMAGFLLIGFGTSNVVPILFRSAGSQRQMPASLAVSAITTVGYAGVLVGPAAIGFLAKATNLGSAFVMLAVLFFFITLASGAVTKLSE